MKECLVESCGGKVSGHGLCSKHYQQMRKHGRISKNTIFDPSEIVMVGDHAEIILVARSGAESARAIIDVQDVGLVSGYRWHLMTVGYAHNNSIGFLHHLITGAKCDYFTTVDHINSNKLDNRRANLRVGPQSLNAANSRLPKNNTSGYKGVCWSKAAKKWMARIKVNFKGIYLGIFDDKIEAAKAYNAAAVKYFGEYAKLNEV